jgi:hypothetical protein
MEREYIGETLASARRGHPGSVISIIAMGEVGSSRWQVCVADKDRGTNWPESTHADEDAAREAAQDMCEIIY